MNGRVGVWTAALLLVPGLALGHGKPKAAANPEPAKRVAIGDDTADGEKAAAAWFTDLEVLDQHGKRHRFYSDLVKDRVVLINFVFASCKTACSPITAGLAKVQRRLKARMGREVHLLTLTVDPARDRPEALQKFAEKFGAGPGWFFLTGSEESYVPVLKRLGGYTANPEEHLTVLLIGDPRTGNWIKVGGHEPAERIAEVVNHINDPS